MDANLAENLYFEERNTSCLIRKIKPKLKLGKKITIYITGGSSGAQRINTVVGEALYELLKKYELIHQTGKLDYEKFKRMRNNFPSDLKDKYEIYDFIDPVDIPQIFERADILVSRAGANTVSEISVTKRPSVLIPIPWTSYDEQTKNARILEKTGIAVVLEEKNLNAANLIKYINAVAGSWQKMVNYSDDSLAEIDKNAAKNFVKEIEVFI